MIITHEYPVCEYDTARDPIIHPTDFLFNRSLHEPKAQMMCFGMKRINLLRFQRRLSNYGTI